MNAQTQGNGNNLLVQGRIVWSIGSSLFEGKKKTDYNSGQVILDEMGQPIIEYGFGIAIPKIDPRTGQPTAEFQKVWQTLHQEAFTLYPNGQLPSNFAMKYKDGDGVDDKGKPFADREGYKGHIVLSCTTQIPIKYFIFQGGNNILVNDGIKVGDYVNVQLNVKAHPPKGRGLPGLYLNPSAVQLIQPGKEIINTPSGDQMFGMQAPVYNGEIVAPVNAPMPNMQAPQMGAPVMPFTQPQAPTVAPAPHYGVLPQTMQPQVPPMGNAYTAAPVAPAVTPMQAPMMNNQNMAPAAYPSNGVPPMPGMPR